MHWNFSSAQNRRGELTVPGFLLERMREGGASTLQDAFDEDVENRYSGAVRSIIGNVSFSAYYSACAPMSCSYVTTDPPDWLTGGQQVLCWVAQAMVLSAAISILVDTIMGEQDKRKNKQKNKQQHRYQHVRQEED